MPEDATETTAKARKRAGNSRSKGRISSVRGPEGENRVGRLTDIIWEVYDFCVSFCIFGNWDSRSRREWRKEEPGMTENDYQIDILWVPTGNGLLSA